MELTTAAVAVTETSYSVICEMLRPGFDSLTGTKIELTHEPSDGESLIEARCKQDVESERKTLVLRLHFLHGARQMLIPNIFMPETMRHQRLGKRLIGALYQVAVAHDYTLFVVDMVPSFYDRLTLRGAVPIDPETVQITATTDLIGDVGSPKLSAGEDAQHFDIFALMRGSS
ncbi:MULTISPECIES: hypothetical protein [Pseudomonas]|uniref:Uncharacterized protein n=4 Tax=Pseudomonas TaxID=286 RepID=A0A3G1DGJ4_PSEAI|nr:MULTISPECIES: hypothetical protein [Pseudomonas]AMP35775.1 Hypothetical protein [Pseudomonas aeruginosa]MCO6692687.1 hypothetical protein [Pseudomonas shirazica]ESW38586.1 hypothetical protein O164_16965 [Pseudomonas taiwanensis SJ9]MCZ9640496.1 hypothetical protein [Pseudomonas putida]TRZ57470.1 hypothetical protein DZA28_29175 [Pseudomonas alloputida]